MIHIPLINKVLRINVIDNKAKRKLTAIAKEIEAMSKDPRWIAFIERERAKESKTQG